MESVTERSTSTVIFILLWLTLLIQLNVTAQIQTNVDDIGTQSSFLRQTFSNSTTQDGDDARTRPTSITPIEYSTIVTPTPTPRDADITSATITLSTRITSEPTTLRSTETCPKLKFGNYTLPETPVGSWATPEGTVCLNKNGTLVQIHCLDNGVWNLSEGITCYERDTSSSTTTTTITTNITTPTTTPSPKPSVKTCPRKKIGEYTLPETTAGSWAIPEGVICLNANYTPVRVQCLRTGSWDLNSKIECPQENISDTTKELYEVLDESPVAALSTTNTIIKEKKSELKEIDIHFISQVLSKASEDGDVATNPETFIGTIDEIMSVNKSTLASSQLLLNATDTILYSLDQMLLKSGNISFQVSNLTLRTIDNNSRKIYGAMITENEEGRNFTLVKDNYEETLTNTDFDIAFVIPPETTNGAEFYFITIFYNDNLFQQKNPETVDSRIISILFPTDVVPENIKIYYKQLQNTSLQRQCDHWKYGIEKYEAISGRWSSDDDAQIFKEGYYLCEVNHTTHFGMLVSGSLSDNLVLDLITIFGSVLSLFAIIIIFLTALIFKQWRNKTTSKILLNVSLCLLLLIVLFIIADKVNRGPLCVVVGILLHYMVLAQFCWSLTISYSSYRKFHLVSNDHIKHVLVKFCGFSWGTPLIAVIATVVININTYDKSAVEKAEQNSSEICYPKDDFLTLGVCVPMTVILTVNAVIYILIAKNLLVTKLDIRKHQTKKSLSVQKSLILLFFMMGMTWTFGILVAFTKNTIFLYLFCSTATLHGFVIFLFYILDSTEIKQMWKKKLKQVITKSKRGEKIKYRQNNRIEENMTESISG
ncbi:adhesion G-protein coupled receptor G6-like [Zophobas morio]|uniref:adhesion G-protein coupled receptor G6-like n=1 Tax=Zophobas morio TaxID=2755281 RepID=UPI003082AE91